MGTTLVAMSSTKGRSFSVGTAKATGFVPVAFAVPTENERPFVLDMATSVVPIGKMEVYRRHSKPVPVGWAIDEKSSPALDAGSVMRCINETKRGGLLPLGGLEETAGYKGYGLSVLVDILCGILPAAAYGPYVGTPEDPKPSNIGHFLAAIDVNAFAPLDEFRKRMDVMIKTIRDSAKANDQDRIYIHGEKEWELEERYRKAGIPLYFKVWESLRDLANQLHLEFNL